MGPGVVGGYERSVNSLKTVTLSSGLRLLAAELRLGCPGFFPDTVGLWSHDPPTLPSPNPPLKHLLWDKANLLKPKALNIGFTFQL